MRHRHPARGGSVSCVADVQQEPREACGRQVGLDAVLRRRLQRVVGPHVENTSWGERGVGPAAGAEAEDDHLIGEAAAEMSAHRSYALKFGAADMAVVRPEHGARPRILLEDPRNVLGHALVAHARLQATGVFSERHARPLGNNARVLNRPVRLTRGRHAREFVAVRQHVREHSLGIFDEAGVWLGLALDLEAPLTAMWTLVDRAHHAARTARRTLRKHEGTGPLLKSEAEGWIHERLAVERDLDVVEPCRALAREHAAEVDVLDVVIDREPSFVARPVAKAGNPPGLHVVEGTRSARGIAAPPKAGPAMGNLRADPYTHNELLAARYLDGELTCGGREVDFVPRRKVRE